MRSPTAATHLQLGKMHDIVGSAPEQMTHQHSRNALHRRVEQSEVARRCLEVRFGAHAVELAERDTQVAYLSSVVGLAEGLLTAKQR